MNKGLVFQRLLIVTAIMLAPTIAQASVLYTYDSVGRLTTALYDNNVCLVYSYDKSGNRTLKTVNMSGPVSSAVWGAGLWGCFRWRS